MTDDIIIRDGRSEGIDQYPEISPPPAPEGYVAKLVFADGEVPRLMEDGVSIFYRVNWRVIYERRGFVI